MEEDHIQIQDVENFKSSKDKSFSHQELLMMALRKCIESGGKEMRSGYFNERYDNQGNMIKTYIEDTRKSFIEAVKTARMIMTCDLDKDAKDNIKKIMDNLQKKLDSLIALEKTDFETQPPLVKQQRFQIGIYHNSFTLNSNLPYYHDFIDKQVDFYRELLGELMLLAKRLDFYEGEEFEA